MYVLCEPNHHVRLTYCKIDDTYIKCMRYLLVTHTS